MLDDLKYINQKDPKDTLYIAQNLYKQLEYEQPKHNKPRINSFDNIVYVGMGGSALAGLLSTSWPGYNTPFELSRSYHLPKYVNSKTMLIVSSYSGNTEEVISALDEGIRRKAQILIITSGGKLESIAKENDIDLYKIPSGYQPRYAVFYNFKVLIDIFGELGILSKKDASIFNNSSSFVKEIATNFIPIVPTTKNIAKQIAQEASGKSAVIYSGPKLFPAAYKWKISFNENAKQVAWCNQFSEFNHNEFIGWSKQPPLKPYFIVELSSNLENPRIQKRIKLSNELLSGLWPTPKIVSLKGDNLLEQLLYAIVLGDFVSLYAAILNGINPEPVDLIESLKSKL